MSNLNLFLPVELPGLNEVIDANRRNKYQGAKLKDKATATVARLCEGVPPIGAAHWHFTWICQDKRRDPDNISSACKFVLDGLQQVGVIKNDGWTQVLSITHAFEVGTPPGVVVTATEAEQ